MVSRIDNSNTVSSHFLTVIKKGLESQGVDSHELFNLVNIDSNELHKKRLRIPQKDIDTILNEAIKITNDDAFAIKLFNHTAPASNLLTVLAGSCETLRMLFNLSSLRYGESYISSIYATLDESTNVKLIFETSESAENYPTYTIDFISIYIVKFFVNLLDDPLAIPLEIKLKRQEPNNIAVFKEYFGCPITFGAEKNEICFDKKIYNLANPLSNKLLTRATKSILEDELKTVTQIPISERTISYINQHLPDKIPKQEDWAFNLNLSVRNLQRQLSSENTSFNELLKFERIKLAKHYLLNTGYSITEVSNLLNFSDSSHFIKTFKQVTGLTPKSYQTDQNFDRVLVNKHRAI